MFIFLYGDDTYRSIEKLNEIKKNFKAKTDPSGINISLFDGENFDLEKFNNAAGQGGFLVSKRLIIVKNLLLNKPTKETAEQLMELLNRLETSDNIFVFWEQGLPEKTSTLFKLLVKNKLAQSFEPLENTKLTNWLKKYLVEKDGQIEKDALEMLISFVGSNLWQLTNELDKLIAYKKPAMITAKDVKDFVIAKLSENIFGLTDALAAENKKEATKLLEEQLNIGLNEVYLLTMITRQFRILVEIKSLLSQGILPSQIAGKLKLHPFVVKKSLPQAKKFTLAKFQKIYQLLVEIDKKLKSTSLSANTLLNLLIVKI